MTLILITGAHGSGKRRWAAQRATEIAAMSESSVVYVSTEAIRDIDSRLRAAQMRKSRPRHWRSLDASHGIAAALLARGDITPGAVLILDSVPALTANLLTQEASSTGSKTRQAVESELRATLRVVRDKKATIIMVTGDDVPETSPSETHSGHLRDTIGHINQWLAQQSDGVWLVICGMALPLHTLATPIQQS